MRGEVHPVICKHCSKENCYEHCQETEDGKHVVDPYSAQQAEGTGLVVDYTCLKCGQSGSVAVSREDISWG